MSDAEDLVKDLVAAKSSDVAEKGSVLPPRIERHSENVVLQKINDEAHCWIGGLFKKILTMMILDPMRMMLNKVEFEFSRRPWPVYKTTLRPALKLLCHIKVDFISIWTFLGKFLSSEQMFSLDGADCEHAYDLKLMDFDPGINSFSFFSEDLLS